MTEPWWVWEKASKAEGKAKWALLLLSGELWAKLMSRAVSTSTNTARKSSMVAADFTEKFLPLSQPGLSPTHLWRATAKREATKIEAQSEKSWKEENLDGSRLRYCRRGLSQTHEQAGSLWLVTCSLVVHVMLLFPQWCFTLFNKLTDSGFLFCRKIRQLSSHCWTKCAEGDTKAPENFFIWCISGIRRRNENLLVEEKSLENQKTF